MRGPDTIIPGDVASALALTLHEAWTDAIKYVLGPTTVVLGQRQGSEQVDTNDACFELIWDQPVASPVTAS